MKKTHERSMIAALVMTGMLAIGGAAQAQSGQLPVMPQVQEQGSVKFISGGIGEGQSDAFKKAASGYRLMLTFVQRGPGGVGEYLAEIPVSISGAGGKKVLETTSQGPYMLVDLPAGSYTIKASSNGQEKTQQVKVGASGTTSTTFEWK